MIQIRTIVPFLLQPKEDQPPNGYPNESSLASKTFAAFSLQHPTVTTTPKEQQSEKFDALLERIVQILDRIKEQSQHHQHDDIIRSEWILVAMVLDRMMLIVFSMLINPLCECCDPVLWTWWQ